MLLAQREGRIVMRNRRSPAASGMMFVDEGSMSEAAIVEYHTNPSKLRSDLLKHVTSVYHVQIDIYVLFKILRSASELIRQINTRHMPDKELPMLDPYLILDSDWIKAVIAKYPQHKSHWGSSAKGKNRGTNQEDLQLLVIAQERFDAELKEFRELAIDRDNYVTMLHRQFHVGDATTSDPIRYFVKLYSSTGEDGTLDPLVHSWRAMMLANLYLSKLAIQSHFHSLDHISRADMCCQLCEPLFHRHPCHRKFVALGIYDRMAVLMHHDQAQLGFDEANHLCKDCKN